MVLDVLFLKRTDIFESLQMLLLKRTLSSQIIPVTLLTKQLKLLFLLHTADGR